MKINKKVKFRNEGSAVVISMLVLSLLMVIVASISIIYFNKIQSIKQINKYYDIKIEKNLKNRKDK